MGPNDNPTDDQKSDSSQTVPNSDTSPTSVSEAPSDTSPTAPDTASEPPTDQPMGAPAQAAGEKCATCGKDAENGNCKACGQNQYGCSCDTPPSGSEPTGEEGAAAPA